MVLTAPSDGVCRAAGRTAQGAGKGAEKAAPEMRGSKLRRKTAQQARATVNRTAVHRKEYDRAAGQYHKSIKRGKVYTKDGQMRIRVYS